MKSKSELNMEIEALTDQLIDSQQILENKAEEWSKRDFDLCTKIQDLTKELNLTKIELEAYMTLRESLLKQHEINCSKINEVERILDENQVGGLSDSKLIKCLREVLK